jgi:hypothetical protein
MGRSVRQVLGGKLRPGRPSNPREPGRRLVSEPRQTQGRQLAKWPSATPPGPALRRCDLHLSLCRKLGRKLVEWCPGQSRPQNWIRTTAKVEQARAHPRYHFGARPQPEAWRNRLRSHQGGLGCIDPDIERRTGRARHHGECAGPRSYRYRMDIRPAEVRDPTSIAGR